MIRRTAVIGVLASLGVLLMSPSAHAHAVLKSSEPAAGAELRTSPSTVLLTFTEDADPVLSFVHVLDGKGHDVERGKAHTVGRNASKLIVEVGPLPKGVYAVSWRAVSRDDGHVTAGAFAFGVGVSPAGALLPKTETPLPSVLSVTSRWLFYSGLFVLLGCSFTMLFVSRDLIHVPLLALVGWIAAAVGLLGLVEAQRGDAGVAFSHLLGSSIGHAFILRAVPLAIALVGVILVRRPSMQWAGFAVVLIASVATALAHTAEGHAATGSWRAGKIFLQWTHVVAGGIWIGGLTTVLTGIGPLDPQARRRVVRRFSTLALWLIAVLAGAGVWRAFEEIGSWHQLFSTSYGQVVIAKAALLLVLIGLGAVNRYRNVPLAGEDPKGLRRTGGVELALAVAVLALTGILSSVAPARALQPAGPSPAVVVTGNDSKKTVRLRLDATPGTPGSTKFQLKVADFDSDAPVHADQISLRFAYLGPVHIASSTLQLKSSGSGTYIGTGANLSLGGVWRVTAVVRRGVTSVEVPLIVPTRVAQQVSVSSAPGQPTLYTVSLSQSRSVQFYVDPGKPGANEVHATFFDTGGVQFNGLSGYFVLETPPQGAPTGLDHRLLAEGHIVSDATLTEGKWRFDIWTRTKKGDLLWSYFEPTIVK